MRPDVSYWRTGKNWAATQAWKLIHIMENNILISVHVIIMHERENIFILLLENIPFISNPYELFEMILLENVKLFKRIFFLDNHDNVCYFYDQEK